MTKYTSIKSVLYDLSLTIDPAIWNEKSMTEWILKGLRKTASDSILKDTIYYAIVENHKVKLPVDLKYINQIIYYNNSNTTKQDLLTLLREEIRSDIEPSNVVLKGYINEKWRPLKLNTSPFAKLLYCDPISECVHCEHEYTIDESMVLTTDLKKGIIAISYKAYPKDDSDEYLMPDDEDLKEALMYYCMYRYYLTKLSGAAMSDKSLLNFYIQERQMCLKMFETLKAKYVGNSNQPTIDQIENIRKMRDRLVPRTDGYTKLFTNLNNDEKLKYA